MAPTPNPTLYTDDPHRTMFVDEDMVLMDMEPFAKPMVLMTLIPMHS